MLIDVKTLNGYQLKCNDGRIGSVRELYFDDQYWAIRYLVADTGNWLTGRQVLISPYALRSVDKADKLIHVELTKKQIEESPPLSSDQPVSHQYEKVAFGYYGWPIYWNGSNMWGSGTLPMRDSKSQHGTNPGGREWNPHLLSTHDVAGHRVHALDGEVGHVNDYIIDDGSWAIRYFVVRTRNWWPSHKVLVSPQWIERVDWQKSIVVISLTSEAIRNAPEFTAESLLSRNYESELYRHYNMPGYWGEVSE